MFEKYHEKLSCYDKKCDWLKFFIKYFLPVILILRTWNIITMFINYSSGFNILDFFINIILVALILMNIALFRYLDKSSYIINMILNCWFIIALFPFNIFSSNKINTEISTISNVFNGVIVLTYIITFAFIGLAILNIVYFYKRKDLFL